MSAMTDSLSSPLRVESNPYIKLKNQITDLKISPESNYVAYNEQDPAHGSTLKVLNLNTKHIYTISQNRVGQAFAWAPKGYRLFYRIQKKINQKNFVSKVFAYDIKLHKSILISHIPSLTGYVTITPQDLMVRIPSLNKVHTFKIHYPGSRLEKWQQTSSSHQKTKWIVGKSGIYLSNPITKEITKIHDDGSQIESFSLSKGGNHITWNTKKGISYFSLQGSKAIRIGEGRYPSWHPNKKVILYSAVRKLGNVIVGSDLRLYDLNKQQKWLTHTAHQEETWPIWLSKDTILYTTHKSNVIYTLEFIHDKITQPFTAFSK